ncbi:protein CLEC16A-like isoform X2 [Saccostrea echinata]|uniref:protein CLEC16A-like isoform X2 n=1 Tax=Saccostrea echinata TaxID=191078 RepID=UPI002A80EE65|nr:protein CLEC16A-like isoform X2 [Saccostrea echinata]
MFQRSKGWLPGLLSKPKNPHSLEHLKYLHSLLCKNQTVTEGNRSLLVETLRSISEILIWGDQNDSSVFDFFLEKNMLSFFLRYLQQKSGRFICVQLLQTLNILFENISNETSLYYLLSNNHINSIIVHKFDFSDEEVMAYYISFLKTLSFKLNRHTIHFFYNEHTNDFALYTEAIKFFNHSEAMVRIAVRTITLNVYRVEDKTMLKYIRNRTAAPYFSNLVWFIGNHILDLDLCVRNDADHQSRDRLADLVAEHLDHLHYLNDILCLNIDALNDVLTDQMLNRLLIPLYVYSLTMRKRSTDRMVDRKHVSSVVSLFLLSQVFLIISYAPLVRQLAEIIFQGEISLSRKEASPETRVREFVPPAESLEKTLESNRGRPDNMEDNELPQSPSSEVFSGGEDMSSPNQNSTDEEKLLSSLGRGHRMELPGATDAEQSPATFSLDNRPYLEAVFTALECTENDYEALFALCLLYAMGHNEGIHQELMDSVLLPTERCETKDHYNVALVECLIRIITLACQHGSKVRLATLELTIRLLKLLVYKQDQSFLQDRHLACIENARECSTQLLRNFYKSEEIFLDMFEDEYTQMINRPLNVEYLTMDASILLPPTGTPLTGIDFNKRLPCGEVERSRRAIRVFFLVRDLSLTLLKEEELQLPLNRDQASVKTNDILDLNNSDLIACTVVMRDTRKQERRFLVIDKLQMILVEPDTRRLGWGVVRFVGYLQDVEVTGDKEDSRSLHITIHRPASSQHTRPVPLLNARFIFDDHIRCMAAKQRLTKGRLKARQLKMHMIEKLIDIPGDSTSRQRPVPGRSHPVRVVDSSPRDSTAQSASRPRSGHVSSSRKSPSSGTMSERNTKTSSVGATATEDVEVAEEAAAFAYQSFNQDTGGVVNMAPEVQIQQEIPLEDLSRKKKRHSGRKLSGTKLIGPQSTHPSRSHSHSPRRNEKKQTKKGLATSLTVTITQPEVSRPHSNSSPIPLSSSPAQSSTSSSENSPQTYGFTRDTSSQSPKTLRPADAPTLSLLPQGGDQINSEENLGPKLLPPTEVERIRSVSDVSSSSSDTQGELTRSNSSGSTSASKPLFAVKASSEAEVNKNSAGGQIVQVGQGLDESTSQQLTKLAQMVQQHYGSVEEEEDPESSLDGNLQGSIKNV